MEVDILKVNYIIDGILFSMPTKVIYERSNENEIQSIHYEIKLENYHIISEASNSTELGIVNLQKALPPNVSIVYCQSCRHGNFCPYGDYDNEVFCLKDITPTDKNDVSKLFSENYDLIMARSRKLLDFCTDYRPISNDGYYTYNDWEL
ncbi:hypothetical protein KQI88_15420 [Alkaliphilus sp. MSJ-5]|uniref:Uncharacterized protein n=1 Tax=Alkaliphilus flagellatus TaxID=2841507 RepID=A0ABS6G7V4_9FIRM|nr:hypothetical protein [Alkaliphilus flagellatus]MBU5677807.1 hypothetical protein [Alkaliphilus flagellatus]